MPQYRFTYRNSESNMVHTEFELLAPDEDTAREWADARVKQECGVGTSADGAQSTVSLPRFTVAVTEVN